MGLSYWEIYFFRASSAAAAAEVPIEFQSNWKSLNPNLAASKLQRSCGKTSIHQVNRGPGPWKFPHGHLIAKHTMRMNLQATIKPLCSEHQYFEGNRLLTLWHRSFLETEIVRWYLVFVVRMTCTGWNGVLCWDLYKARRHLSNIVYFVYIYIYRVNELIIVSYTLA